MQILRPDKHTSDSGSEDGVLATADVSVYMSVPDMSAYMFFVDMSVDVSVDVSTPRRPVGGPVDVLSGASSIGAAEEDRGIRNWNSVYAVNGPPRRLSFLQIIFSHAGYTSGSLRLLR